MDDAEYENFLSSVTPTESADGVESYRNTVAMACPACGDPFDDAVVCTDEYNSLELSLDLDLCVTTHDGDAILFTHKP